MPHLLPDNRIRFPAGPVDFTDDVGTTGQDHDSYPFAATQARFDWMRLFLHGLLSNQSSHHEPTQFREGTLWFDLSTGPEGSLQVRLGSGSDGEWKPASEAIFVESDDGTSITLNDFFQQFLSVTPGVDGSGTLVVGDPSTPQIKVIFDAVKNRYTIRFLQTEVDHKFIKNTGTFTHDEIDAHINDTTGNPHSITATQVGKDTAQWNANRIQGELVDPTAPVDNQVLAFNFATSKYEPVLVDDSLLQDDAVPTSKIVDGAVTEPKLATDSVTRDKIKDGEINDAKLAPGTARLSFESISPIVGTFEFSEFAVGSEGDMSKTFVIELSDFTAAGASVASLADISMFWIDIDFDVDAGGMLPGDVQLRIFSTEDGSGTAPTDTFDVLFELGSTPSTDLVPESLTRHRTTILVPRTEVSVLRLQLFSADDNFSVLKFSIVGIMAYGI